MLKSALTTLVFLASAVPSFAEDLLFFRSPTGNISCMIATGDYPVVRCDLRDLIPNNLPAPPTVI